MKHIKRITCALLALMLVMSLSITVFAATGTFEETKGKITVGNVHEGATYKIYRILDLMSFDTDNNAYVYKANSAWKTWVESTAGGAKYLNTDSNGNVTWIKDADVKAFVKAALAYAQDSANGITAIASKTAGSAPVVFENLDLGYYLLDSSIGALASIDSTATDITINDKNTPPTVDKKVKNGDNWAESVSAKIGETVTFSSKITVYEGTHNLVYRDKMQNSLTYAGDDTVVVSKLNGTERTPLTEGTDYTVVSTGLAEGIAFEVRFTETYMESITAYTQLTVVYEATLNENALIYDKVNRNEAKLTYGDDGETDWDPADVITYKFAIVKTNVANKVLEGAEFKIYTDSACTDANELKLVEDYPDGVNTTTADGYKYYRPATAAEMAADGFTPAVITIGKAVVWGVHGNHALYLKETKAPEGYNALTTPVHVTALEAGSTMPTFDLEGLYVSGGVEIENLTGSQLPQTGGMGTTLFYIVGSIMVLGAAVMLITKKRMAAAN